MESRKFGRTNHESTLAVFGGVALGKLNQSMADKVLQQVLNAGVNHFDVAPAYGDAELRLGPWMPKIRKDIFLGCKTMARDKEGAQQEFQQSLERLQVEAFDLYQCHAITTMEELDACTSTGGALEGILEMHNQGLTRFIGITGHGMDVPTIFIEALNRFSFDSVLFPINPTLFSDSTYRENSLALLDLCEHRDIGVMIIKAAAKKPWGESEHQYHTWYTPFDEEDEIQKNINFVLSYPHTHICTPGDYRLLSMTFSACQNFTPLQPEAMEALIAERSELPGIF